LWEAPDQNAPDTGTTNTDGKERTLARFSLQRSAAGISLATSGIERGTGCR
jgi:hypothetical protein